MKIKVFCSAMAVAVLSGCASVPTADNEKEAQAKAFSSPSEGMAGVYVYRSAAGVGAALKKDIYINGDCVGETAPGVFFFQEVEGDKEHTISTESEFSPNDITLETRSGELYYIKQYIKFGLFVGGAGLEVMDEQEGQAGVAATALAISGTCSNM